MAFAVLVAAALGQVYYPPAPPAPPAPPVSVPVPPAPPASPASPPACPLANLPAPDGAKCVQGPDKRYVCPLPAGGALQNDTIYVGATAANATYTLPTNSALVGKLVDELVVGGLVIAGDGVVVCDVTSSSRLTITGASARDVVIQGLDVVDDEVAIVIVGASPKINSIDVTGLTLGGISPRPIVLAAAHAQADSPVVVPCDANETLLLQPLVPRANITAAAACTKVDLAELLNVFGRPYEVRSAAPPLRARSARADTLRARQVSFYSWGANDAGVTAWLGRLGTVIAAADAVLAVIVVANWGRVSTLVKEKQQ